MMLDQPSLPALWQSRRAPAWWQDEAIRTFVLRGFKRCSITELARQGRIEFGAEFPSKSALHRVVTVLRRGAGEASVELVEIQGFTMPETERAALATRLMLSITGPDMGPALTMAAALLREHARGLSGQISGGAGQ